ncbi:MAG: hypothetical protein PVF58_15965 [Candidatus Methanofastidiosia archaeon]
MKRFILLGCSRIYTYTEKEKRWKSERDITASGQFTMRPDHSIPVCQRAESVCSQTF